MRYTVYHKTLTDGGRNFQDNTPEDLAAFPTGWVLTATVEAPDVEQVFALTNHITSNWTDNAEVIELFTPKSRTRSTSVGDVYVAETGERFTVDNEGTRSFTFRS